MNAQDFVSRYGDIYEHSPWVAEEAAGIVGDDVDLDTLARIMADCVDNSSRQRRLDLIRAHPDLAGRASISGALTPDSSAEQASAGLEHCSAEEFERFQSLNTAYRDKFGFPFVMAVRDSSRAEILAAFERRLANDRDTEFETAIAEIHRIARLRLRTLEVA